MKEIMKCVVCGVEVEKFQIGHHYKKEHPDFDYNAYKESLKIKICPICGKEFRKGKTCQDCREEYYLQKNIIASKLKYKNAPKNSYVVCAICGFHAGNLNSHLSLVHNTNTEDYRSKYNSPTCSDDYLHNCSEKLKGDKNPGWQHGGKFSPFSDKFIGTTTKEEVLSKVKQTKDENFSHTTRIDYYLHRGYTQEEAELALKERQTTFSKDICVDKHGEVEGSKIWEERQIKWISSLYNRPQEEMDIINIKKLPAFSSLSGLLEVSENEVLDILGEMDYDAYQVYSNKITKLSNEVYYKYIDEIDPDRLRGRVNGSGYDLDHKYSRFVGFLKNIPVEIMSYKDNLQILSMEDNTRKNIKCSITLEELLNLYKCQQQEVLIE